MWEDVKKIIKTAALLYSAHRSAKLTDLSSTKSERQSAGLYLISIFMTVTSFLCGLCTLPFVMIYAIMGIASAIDPVGMAEQAKYASKYDSVGTNWVVVLVFVVSLTVFLAGIYICYLSATWEEIDWDDKSQVIASKKVGDTTYELRK